MNTGRITKKEHPFISLNKIECPFCQSKIIGKYSQEDIVNGTSAIEYRYSCGFTVVEKREKISGQNGDIQEVYHLDITQVCGKQESLLIKFLEMKKQLEKK